MSSRVTVCRNCGVSCVGVVRLCPECGSSDLAERRTGLRPRGCDCGLCEVLPDAWEFTFFGRHPGCKKHGSLKGRPHSPCWSSGAISGLVIRCSGTAMALANAGGAL